jgi:hypothetical protein
MGKLRNPLRKNAEPSADKSASLADRVEQKRRRLEDHDPGRRQQPSKKQKNKKGKNADTDDGSSSDDDEERDGENGGGVRLDRTISHERVEVTFEFSDMHTRFEEGITLLLKWMLPSHEAYELGSAICRQGEVLISPLFCSFYLISGYVCAFISAFMGFQWRWARPSPATGASTPSPSPPSFPWPRIR